MADEKDPIDWQTKTLAEEIAYWQSRTPDERWNETDRLSAEACGMTVEQVNEMDRGKPWTIKKLRFPEDKRVVKPHHVKE